jgi:hypothetical protein
MLRHEASATDEKDASCLSMTAQFGSGATKSISVSVGFSHNVFLPGGKEITDKNIALEKIKFNSFNDLNFVFFLFGATLCLGHSLIPD